MKTFAVLSNHPTDISKEISESKSSNGVIAEVQKCGDESKVNEVSRQ